MRYKNTRKSMPEIGRELSVDALMEGSVQCESNRVRINARLVGASADQHLWAEAYDRDLRDVLVLQDEVARTIAREIQVKLTPEEHVRLSNSPTVDPDAYQLYIKGRYFSVNARRNRSVVQLTVCSRRSNEAQLRRRVQRLGGLLFFAGFFLRCRVGAPH